MSLFTHEYNRDAFLQIQPDGRYFKMWSNPHCARLYQMASFESYSVEMVQAMASRLSCFVDVGAHHGYYSLLVGSTAPGCKIIAFEAAAENFATLKQNLDENNLGTARTYSCAISNVEAIKDFCISTASDNCGFIAHPATPTQKVVQVQAYLLDHFREEMPAGPTLIKIDTEGHEIEVLDGMQEIIQSVADLKLLVEFNPKLLKLAGHAPKEMLTKLDALGFDLYLLSDADGLFFHLPGNARWQDYLTEQATTNILCLKKQSRLDVLFFSHSGGLNGAERSLLEKITYFIHHGSMCTVVFPEAGPMVQLVKRAGAAVLIRKFYWWGSFEYLAPDEQSRRLDASFRWLIEDQSLLQKINPDVVFTNTTVIPWGALIAQMLGKPHIWSITEFGEAAGIAFFIPFADVLQVIEGSSNFIMSNSQAIQKTLFPHLGSDQIETIYAAVQTPIDDPAEPVERLFSENVLRLVLIGTIIPVKGHLDAIMAVRELVIGQGKTDVELVLIGSIGLKSYYDEMLEAISQHQLQKHVRILDFQKNIFGVLQQADILLICSRMEAFGRITLEAMLLGKPVIGANSGGTPELVQDDLTGFLYQPGDHQMLAEKISYLYDHPKRRQELGQKGMAYAQAKFATQSTHERMVDIASKLKNQKNASSNSTITRLLLHLTQNSINMQHERTTEQGNKIQSTLTDVQKEKEHLLNELRGKNREKEDLLHQLRDKDKEKEALVEELRNKKQELNEIYRSKAWHSVQQYRHLIEQLRKMIFKK